MQMELDMISWYPLLIEQGEGSGGAQGLEAIRTGYQSQGVAFMDSFFKAGYILITSY